MSSRKSSESSDTETILEEEVKQQNKKQVTKDWEAIERTLYQEVGQQVTNSALLKECKLWRDTFPHFRVRGNQLNIKKLQNLKTNEKNVLAIQSPSSFNKINEKRENIKKTVVNGLVQRLITKFNVNTFTTENKNNLKKPVEITEINENSSDVLLQNFNDSMEYNKNNNTFEISNRNKELKNSFANAETESYFERGKLFDSIDEIGKDFEKDTLEERYYEMFDVLEKKFKNENFFNEFETKNEIKEKNYKKEKLETKPIKAPESKRIGVDLAEKPAFSCRKSPLPNHLKPIEIKSKISKKYEGLLTKILNQNCAELDLLRHCPNQHSEMKPTTISELPENNKLQSPEDCYITLPKINKFNNNWINRGANSYTAEEYKNKSQLKLKKNLSPFFLELAPENLDKKFMKDLQKDILVKNRKTSLQFGGVENFNVRRPKLYSHNCEHTHKSLSCGDLPKKKNKHFQKVQVSHTLEKGQIDGNIKPRSKSTNLNKSKPKKIVDNKNGLLPPIESGIIITELSGRPKIGPVMLPKKR